MITVVKANGETEPFSQEKVLSSIKRSGIPKALQDEALIHIQERLKDQISTKEIYRHILEFLDRSPEPFAKSKYSLKQSIMDLGPTGYPFEDFIAKILEDMGYETKVRQNIMGKCISHEIDVIAEKDGKKSMVEAKFHNNPGTRSQVHVALYTKARFDDIKEQHAFDEAWIVTNTKTTIDVNTYAKCVGMKVISWNYPDGDSLRDMIDRSGLHPITALSTISEKNKSELLKNSIVMCRDICRDSSIIDRLAISREDKEKILDEARFVCSTEQNF